MKRILALVLAAAMCLTVLAACASSAPPKPEAPAAPTEPAKPAEPVKVEEPVTTVAPGETTAPVKEVRKPFEIPYDDWSNMTDDQLYNMALGEKKTQIAIYSISGKTETMCDLFNETYPGLSAVSQKIKQNPLLEKIKLEARGGNPTADIAWLKDQAGEIYYDPTVMDLFDIFYPADICKQIDTRYLEFCLPLYSELNLWYYNKKMYPDAPPVTNWWDIIEKDADGKQKFALIMQNPTNNSTYTALCCMMVLNPDMMEKAYKDKYGKDLEYTYDANQTFGLLKSKVPAKNAGYEFLYRMSQLKLTFSDDGDTIVKAAQEASVPTLAFASAGKISNSTEDKPLSWVPTNFEPFVSVLSTPNLYILKGTKHPAGARLWIRFAFGGADGKGEGFKPLTGVGNWPIRKDMSSGKNPFKISDTNALPLDITGVNGIYDVTVEFWDYWLSKSTNK